MNSSQIAESKNRAREQRDRASIIVPDGSGLGTKKCGYIAWTFRAYLVEDLDNLPDKKCCMKVAWK